MIGILIAMRRIADVYLSLREKQTRPLALHKRSKAGGGDRHRTQRAICPGPKVQRVQALQKTVAYPRCGYYVERAILGVDYRGSDNAHIPIHVCTAVFAIVDIGRRSKIDVPERFRSVRIIGIEGIYAVVHGGDVYQVMCPTAQFHIGHNQWLAINLIVNHSPKQHAKLLGAYIGWGE